VNTPVDLVGWELLRSPLPPEALKPLGNEVGYGPGMTGIDKAFIYDRLNHCGLNWSVPPASLRFEDVPRDQHRKDKDGNPYVVAGFESVCTLTLEIDGRDFPGVGGDWNLGWGDARKGALTDAIGRAAMLAGIGLEVWLNRLTDEQKAHLAAQSASDGRKAAPSASMGDCPVCGIGEVVLTKKGDRVKCSKMTYNAATKEFGGCKFGMPLADWRAQSTGGEAVASASVAATPVSGAGLTPPATVAPNPAAPPAGQAATPKADRERPAAGPAATPAAVKPSDRARLKGRIIAMQPEERQRWLGRWKFATLTPAELDRLTDPKLREMIDDLTAVAPIVDEPVLV